MTKNVFDFLDNVKQRPGMFFGSATGSLDALVTLETMLFGYSAAIRSYAIAEPGRNFCLEFGQYLWRAHRMSTSCGVVDAIIRSCNSDPDASWEAFWRHVELFRRSVTDRVKPPARTELTSDDLTAIEVRHRRVHLSAWRDSIKGRHDIAGATDADYNFIAAAWQDIPRLLDEVERLRSQLAFARQSRINPRRARPGDARGRRRARTRSRSDRRGAARGSAR